jgi:hypothetical protein
MAEQQTSRVTQTTPTTPIPPVGQQWEYCELRLYSSKSHPVMCGKLIHAFSSRHAASRW